MSDTNNFDVVVIGAGPGGYVAAARAAALGLRTAVVEKDSELGGTCLHRGCIPTKALLHAADVYGEIKDAAKIGIVADGVLVEWEKVQKHKSQIIKANAAGVRHLMKGRQVEVVSGFGSLLDPNTVRVRNDAGQEAKLATKNVILAVGSKPRALPFAPFDGKRIMSSDHILGVEKIPGTLTLIGGGVIGIEFASLFARLGTKVTVLEMLPQILGPADPDCAQELTRELKRQGCDIKTNVQVTGVSANDLAANVTYQSQDGASHQLESEIVLVAIGRPPLTQGIGLENTGATLDSGGFVDVNGMMQSAEPSIFAIGDCVRTPWLAHVASFEGIIAAEYLAGENPAAMNYDHTPSCVYSEPPVAWAGLTEAQALEAGHDVKISRFDFSRNAKASIIGKKRGFVKFITDKKYGEILGVHIVGPQATDLLAEPAFAMAMETTIDDLAKTVHAHPTLYESIYEAAAIASGRAIHG
jgi:dihydrolipoamide dehydrogenase